MTSKNLDPFVHTPVPETNWITTLNTWMIEHDASPRSWNFHITKPSQSGKMIADLLAIEVLRYRVDRFAGHYRRGKWHTRLESGTLWETQQQIADAINCSKREVRKAIGRLKGQHLISVEREGYTSKAGNACQRFLYRPNVARVAAITYKNVRGQRTSRTGLDMLRIACPEICDSDTSFITCYDTTSRCDPIGSDRVTTTSAPETRLLEVNDDLTAEVGVRIEDGASSPGDVYQYHMTSFPGCLSGGGEYSDGQDPSPNADSTEGPGSFCLDSAIAALNDQHLSKPDPIRELRTLQYQFASSLTSSFPTEKDNVDDEDDECALTIIREGVQKRFRGYLIDRYRDKLTLSGNWVNALMSVAYGAGWCINRTSADSFHSRPFIMAASSAIKDYTTEWDFRTEAYETIREWQPGPSTEAYKEQIALSLIDSIIDHAFSELDADDHILDDFKCILRHVGIEPRVGFSGELLLSSQ